MELFEKNHNFGAANLVHLEIGSPELDLMKPIFHPRCRVFNDMRSSTIAVTLLSWLWFTSQRCQLFLPAEIPNIEPMTIVPADVGGSPPTHAICPRPKIERVLNGGKSKHQRRKYLGPPEALQ
jgi:hypothetical protein